MKSGAQLCKQNQNVCHQISAIISVKITPQLIVYIE
jgi:hypothetical protein